MDFVLSRELLHRKDELSPWQTGWCTSAVGPFPSANLPLWCWVLLTLVCNQRFTWIHLDSLLLCYLSSLTWLFFPSIFPPSHLYKHKPPAADSGHRWCSGDQCPAHRCPPLSLGTSACFSCSKGCGRGRWTMTNLKLTVEKTTEGRCLDSGLPMTKGRDENSMFKDREVLLHSYNAQFYPFVRPFFSWPWSPLLTSQ